MTYTTNGTHMVNSLHYDGNAVDLRTRDLSASDRAEALQSLRNELGADYRVIDEGDHIHIGIAGLVVVEVAPFLDRTALKAEIRGR